MKNKYKNEYGIWKAMRARCSSECLSHLSWQQNKIKVCDRWNSFKIFIEDMGERPSKLHSIERKNNSKDYNQDNCIWATYKEQANNRGDFNINIEYNNQIMTLKQLSEKLNLNYSSMHKHIVYKNRTLEETIKLMNLYKQNIKSKSHKTNLSLSKIKISFEDALEIRNKFLNNTLSPTAEATRLNVSRQTIYNASRNKFKAYDLDKNISCQNVT